jgi:hypothetical protein
MRFEVLTAVKMLMLVFWIVTPCGLVGRYQRFGGTYCLHLQVFSPKAVCSSQTLVSTYKSTQHFNLKTKINRHISYVYVHKVAFIVK